MHLGRYHELDVMDILNDPNEMPDMDNVGARTRMEVKLGMWGKIKIKIQL